jgi:hypothetical protein
MIAEMSPVAPEGYWIRTDEAEDVAGSIRQALRCMTFTESDGQAWKWVALALHSALQGACVCHLVTTASPVGAVTERNAGEWLEYFEKRRDDPAARPPQTYLLILPDLLKALRKSRSAGDRSNASGVRLSDQELSWLRRFHDEVRNQFVHFEPMGWSLEVSDIPRLAQLIARIIEEILELGWAFRHKDAVWREALLAHLKNLRAAAHADETAQN